MIKTNPALAEKISHQIPKYSKGRYDLLPIFSDVTTFNEIIAHLCEPYRDKVSCVCALEATGWILGVAMAQYLNVSFIPIRKGGKLPYPAEMIKSVELTDYSHEKKQLCLKENAVPKGAKVLLVDEWIETGSQLLAAIELLKQFDCEIVGSATISIRGEAEKKQNLAWIESGFVHAVGISIRRYEG